MSNEEGKNAQTSLSILDNVARYEQVLPVEYRGIGAINLEAAIGYAKESFVKDGVPPGVLSRWYNIPRTTIYRYAKSWVKLRESTFIQSVPSQAVIEAAARKIETAEELNDGVGAARSVLLRHLELMDRSEQKLTLKELEIVAKIHTSLSKELETKRVPEGDEEPQEMSIEAVNAAMRAFALQVTPKSE